jgi:serine/threonine-protein phosphatase 4 catalytic subunit
MIEIQGKLAYIEPDESSRILVLGDIHGDLAALNRAVGMLAPSDLLVCLGDYADRGPQGVEVIDALIALSERLPGRIVTLKGNHEDYSADGTPLFYPCTLIEEAERKGIRWRDYFPKFQAFVGRSCIAAVVPGSALLLHGGISDTISTLQDLKEPSPGLMNDIIWSDPGSEPGLHGNPRGAGVVFGPDISADVMNKLDVRYLIRSHQPRKALSGPAVEHDGRVITTSSTSVYGGRAFALVLTPANLQEKLEPANSTTIFLD